MQSGDDVDRANDLIQREIDARRAAVHVAAARVPVTTGRCFYCDEPVGMDKRFCSASCRDEWQREQDARRRNGY